MSFLQYRPFKKRRIKRKQGAEVQQKMQPFCRLCAELGEYQPKEDAHGYGGELQESDVCSRKEKGDERDECDQLVQRADDALFADFSFDEAIAE